MKKDIKEMSMDELSNVITDMILEGADHSELETVIKCSMDVIDSTKNK